MRGWKMKCEMAMLAEHLNIFDGVEERWFGCWTACVDSLVIYNFLGSWEILAWFIRKKYLYVLFWPDTCIGAAKLSMDECKDSFGDRFHKHKLESFQVVVCELSASDSQLHITSQILFQLASNSRRLYWNTEVQGGCASDDEGLWGLIVAR